MNTVKMSKVNRNQDRRVFCHGIINRKSGMDLHDRTNTIFFLGAFDLFEFDLIQTSASKGSSAITQYRATAPGYIK